jgi:hypothetical protein
VEYFARSSAQAGVRRVIKTQVFLREISLKGTQPFPGIGHAEPPDKT